MIYGNQIQTLLDQGYTVFSYALGRVGKVLGTNQNLVCIKFHRGSGMTSFTGGDPVELQVDHNKKVAKIIHPDSVWKQ